MQIKTNINNKNLNNNDSVRTKSGIIKSLLVLLFFSFFLTNNVMAGEVIFLENRANNNKKDSTASPYNAFSIGYKFNYLKNDAEVYDFGHGFTITYDRDFVHTKYFSFGMGFGYDYGKYSTEDVFTPEWDITDDINAAVGGSFPAGSYFAKERVYRSLTLHEADINFNFIFNLTRKFKLLAQIGASVDFYMFKADLYLQAYGRGEFVEEKMESAKELDISVAINTNVGFDYDITRHFGIRALFKSSYCNTMSGLNATLGLVIAGKISF